MMEVIYDSSSSLLKPILRWEGDRVFIAVSVK